MFTDQHAFYKFSAPPSKVDSTFPNLITRHLAFHRLPP